MARPGPSFRGVDRAHGMRTFLVNCSGISFLVGVPRLLFLSLLRALGFLFLRRFADAHAEVGAARYLLTRGRLLEGRRARRRFRRRARPLHQQTHPAAQRDPRRRRVPDPPPRRGGRRARSFARNRCRFDVARTIRSGLSPGRPVGVARRCLPGRPRVAGLRRPPVVVPVDAALPGALRPAPRPARRPARGAPGMVFVEVDQSRMLRSLLLAPPVLFLLGLTAVALIANWSRLGLDLAGGRLLPIGTRGGVVDLPGVVAPGFRRHRGPRPCRAGGPRLDPRRALVRRRDAVARRHSPRRVVRLHRVARHARTTFRARGGGRLLRLAAGVDDRSRRGPAGRRRRARRGARGVRRRVRGAAGSSTHAWLAMASGTAIGVAVMGAFSPLTHVVMIVGALAGFVAVTGGARRIAALFASCCCRWRCVAVARGPAAAPGDGVERARRGVHSPPPNLIVCSVFVAAAFAAAVLRPSAAMLPGLLVIVLAIGALAAVAAVKAWPGTPLVLLAWGLVYVVLAGCQRGVAPGVAGQAGSSGCVCGRCGDAGQPGGGRDAGSAFGAVEGRWGDCLSPSLTAELDRTGRSVLILGAPTRQVAGRMPAFGDDDLVPTVSSPARLRRWNSSLLDGSANAVG